MKRRALIGVGRSKRNLLVILVIFIVLISGIVIIASKKTNSPGKTGSTAQKNIPYASKKTDEIANNAAKLIASSKPNEALKVYDEFLATKSATKTEEAYILMQKGSALAMFSKDYSAAIKSYEAAISLTPDDPMPYVGIGQTLEWQGKTTESKQQYKKALEVYDAGPPSGYNGPSRKYFESRLDGTYYQYLLKGDV